MSDANPPRATSCQNGSETPLRATQRPIGPRTLTPEQLELAETLLTQAEPCPNGSLLSNPPHDA